MGRIEAALRTAHLALTAALLALACGSNGNDAAGPHSNLSREELELLQSLSPAELPAVPADVSNRFADSADAAHFGQKIFFERGFAGRLLDGDNDGSVNALGMRGDTGKVACADCHVPAAGFIDNRSLGKQISLAAGWGRRKASSLLDIGYVKLLTWDGRRDSLFNQPFAPFESPVEMNSSRLFVAQQVQALYRAEYEALFGPLPQLADTTRFPALTPTTTGCQPAGAATDPKCNGSEHGIPGDNAEFDAMAPADRDAVTQVVVNVGKALGAYQRLLTCGQSRFDAWMRGDAGALTESEQRGAQVFVGPGKCVSCHSGPTLSDGKFHNVGLKPATVAVVFIDSDDQGAEVGLSEALSDPLNVRGKYSDGDDGRLPEAIDPSLRGAFRTPMLRCNSRHPSFMHTAQMATLEQVVTFFNHGGDTFGFPGKSEIQPLDLSVEQQADLVAFLKALDGAGPDAKLLVKP